MMMNRRIIAGILIGAVFSALFFGNMLTHASSKPKAEAGGHGAKKEEEARPDPSKYEFHNNPQSLKDLVEDDVEAANKDNVKVIYRTPETCAEFSIYMQEKQKKLLELEDEIRRKQDMLNKLTSEFDAATKKFSETEDRIQKLVQRDPTDLKNNPELAKMIKLYESLSAEEAAERLKNLDLDLTLALLKGMKPKKLTSIMSAMEPKLAAALSSQIVRGF